MPDYFPGASFTYSAAGSNTLVQVTPDPATLYQISLSQFGGSMGYLQIYNNGTGDAGAGTPDFVIPLGGTAGGAGGAGTPTVRDVNFGPVGLRMSGGISYLWAAGATGTVAHGVNAILNVVFRGTELT